MNIEALASVNPWAVLDMDTVESSEASLGVFGGMEATPNFAF